MAITRQDVAEFHVVTRGSCWLHLPGSTQPIPLQGGDLVVFPHGDAHALTDAADNSSTLPAETLMGDQDFSNYGPLIHGGKGFPADLLCGYFRFSSERPHPLVQALPNLIHIRGTGLQDLAWLQTTLNFMCLETRLAKPGTEAVLNSLVKVLFVLAVRAHMAQSPAQAGLLTAIADRQIGAALQLLHDTPAEPWTLESIAQRLGMSRSAFAGRFHSLTGETPLRYLTRLRMDKACELLRDSRLGMAEIAEQSGYQSEAAFGKAFKKALGTGPGTWRKSKR